MNFGIWELLVVLVIVMVIFGAGKLGSIGSDLGKAVRGFRNAVDSDNKNVEREKHDDDSGTPS